MVRAVVLLTLSALALLCAQEDPDDAGPALDPLQARLAATRFEREHRLFERDKLREEALRRLQDEEEGDGYDYGYEEEGDAEGGGGGSALGSRGRKQQAKSAVLFASLERSYSPPPGASRAGEGVFLPDPAYSIGATVVIKVPVRLASEEAVNATMRVLHSPLAIERSPLQRLILTLLQAHGCAPRRDMAPRAARGEAEERQDAARARDDKLRRLQGQAIKESYLEGRQVQPSLSLLLIYAPPL